MFERPKEVCETCKGTGRVVDERQAGEQVATCMTCRGNGWIYADKKEPCAKRQRSSPRVSSPDTRVI
jgi:DnaJ-class molecular chaperone